MLLKCSLQVLNHYILKELSRRHERQIFPLLNYIMSVKPQSPKQRIHCISRRVAKMRHGRQSVLNLANEKQKQETKKIKQIIFSRMLVR